ncbi:MAG: hypothetical protein AB9880_02930 [Christensenellales bacterium]
MSIQDKSAPHGVAGRVCASHPGRYVLMTLGQLLLRALALSPLIYAALTKSFFGAPQAHIMGIALLACLPLFLLLVLPMRYYLGGILSGWLGYEGPHPRLDDYPRWLGQNLGRMVLVLPWLLPLAGYLGAFYYYMNISDFPSFFLMIKSVGGLVGGDYLHGVVLLMLLLLVCLLLALWGWHRQMPLFYLPLRPLREDARRLRRLHRAKPRLLRRASILNLLIVLPPLLATLAVLAGSLISRLTGDIQMDLMIILPALTAFDFPQTDLVKVGLVFLLLYLPFVLWRKTALASAIHRSRREP